MGNYKVAVYAICKNEAAFAQRWMQSMAEADVVVVLDTGSIDNTPALLRSLGAVVHQQEIVPWRFDTARNRSLQLVPEDVDICVCTDLDETFHPGWRKALEQAWGPEICQLRYRYTWSFGPSGEEGVVFWPEKIHRRHGFCWIGPVHETLCYQGQKPFQIADGEGIQLDHHPDPQKPRSQYLALLEQAVAETPENDRNTHYLGREYLFYRRWDDCIRTLRHHLEMPTATWCDERCASMRYIARALLEKGMEAQARCWLYRAMGEAPHLREPYLDLAALLAKSEEWNGVVWLCRQALAIAERPRSYICEAEAWGALPHDLLSLGLYYTGAYNAALEEVERALALAPEDSRLQANRAYMAQATAAAPVGR